MRSYIRGNSYDRRRRRARIVARDSVGGVVCCRFCVRALALSEISVVRVDPTGRFTLANCVAACADCTRSPEVRSLFF